MFNTNVLEASRINKVKKLVYTSSIGAYSNNEVFVESDDNDQGPPMDMYPGWAKKNGRNANQSISSSIQFRRLFYCKTLQCVWSWR